LLENLISDYIQSQDKKVPESKDVPRTDTESVIEETLECVAASWDKESIIFTNREQEWYNRTAIAILSLTKTGIRHSVESLVVKNIYNLSFYLSNSTPNNHSVLDLLQVLNHVAARSKVEDTRMLSLNAIKQLLTCPCIGESEQNAVLEDLRECRKLEKSSALQSLLDDTFDL